MGTALGGKYVTLVPLSEAHVEPLYHALNDPQIWEHLRTKVATIDDMRQILMQAMDESKAYTGIPFAIHHIDTDAIVGTTRIGNIHRVHRRGEIGWTWLSPRVWRTGVNTESKYLLLRHCFETLNLSRVEFKVNGPNYRSQKAIERIGATKEGVLRKNLLLNGHLSDQVIYSILDREWTSVKKLFETSLLK